MRIQYISDIHLEFYSALLKEKRFSPQAEILCLAGDIGYPSKPIYRQFLKTVSEQYKKIFLIAGNHEYYNSESMESVQETISEIVAAFPNITFLDNSYEDYEGFRFVGTTLWSKIPAPKLLTLQGRVCNGPGALINDFDKIPDMTPALYNELHEGACEFLEEALNESPLPVVVMTHHLPSFELIDPQYAKYKDMNAFFASSCERFFKAPVRAWIYGHTHTPAITIRDGIQFVCNPVGYPSESSKRIDLNAIVEVA